ncbi:hypothetical protein [Corynebacterium sp. EPI-003-04-2554_SCH2473622]|uniref:hypothetical protein n=1 Tax=Corynebacterium sp. EPI-003-04-2554_SCH2473622 TaxID=1834153 RepID=UPI0007EB0A23|nr:hypothetical protein [Corynebacterium sp. EPI-003-04-2554_SCH2473622]OBA52573.1 hypothetical protein A5774_08815 [Corynebacterium sp. EPI-003-04-2554_SCH2473622]
MANQMHPSLIRLYKNAAARDSFLYLDESYSVPDEYESGSFYILTVVKLTFNDLTGTRRVLRDIAGKNHWHTTDELRTSEGKARTIEMLKQFNSWGDTHLISVEIPLHNSRDLERARGNCLRALLTHVYLKDDDEPPKGLIFEKRLRNKDDDRDRRLIKKLKNEKIVPRDIGTAWVSPADECLLWTPDITYMAYRRQITHKEINETGSYFNAYLEEFSTIIQAPHFDR